MVVPKQVCRHSFTWYSSLDILRMHISFDGDHFDLQQLRKIMGTYTVQAYLVACFFTKRGCEIMYLTYVHDCQMTMLRSFLPMRPTTDTHRFRSPSRGPSPPLRFTLLNSSLFCETCFFYLLIKMIRSKHNAPSIAFVSNITYFQL